MNKKEYLTLKNNDNYWFGQEWSNCYYLALNCYSKNNEIYPEIILEVSKYREKINWVKIFDSNKSLSELCSISKPWKSEKKQIENVLSVYNEVPAS